MTVASDIQTLEPGNLVELFVLDGTAFGGDLVRFQGQSKDIVVWQGEDYYPWPLKASGFERTSLQPPTPKLVIGNIDGSISALCYQFDDLVGAILTRKRTFKRYLDGQPDADPDEHFPDEIWFIESKQEETVESVTFELSSALNFLGVQIPRRQIIANFCQWIVDGGYRGSNCGYTGPPVAKADDTPTSDPDLDKCGGRLSSCKLRQWGLGQKLPFGAFPAAGLIRT